MCNDSKLSQPMSLQLCILCGVTGSRSPKHSHADPAVKLDQTEKDQRLDWCRLIKLLSFERAMDTVVWQLLASVICPGQIFQVANYTRCPVLFGDDNKGITHISLAHCLHAQCVSISCLG